MVIWAWAAVASAGGASWPAVAADYGFAAVHAELEVAVLSQKSEKKLANLLDSHGLGELSMPARATAGAELSLASVGVLSDCRYDGALVCGLTAQLKGGMSAADFVASCRTLLGGALPLTLVPATSDDGLRWDVRGVDTCWKLDGAEVLLSPVVDKALDGVGAGDELHPPELVELDYHQVMAILSEHAKGFAYCQRKHPESSVSGTLELAFTIAEDGSVGSVAPKESTIDAGDPVVSCIVSRFERVRFPKPMGGFSEGAFPVTLLGSP